MNDLLNDQEVLVVILLYLERQTVKVEISSKICSELINHF